MIFIVYKINIIYLSTYQLNNKTTNDGLFNLHWLLVNELPHTLNI